MTPILRAIQEPRRQRALQLIWEQELPAGDIHQAMPEVSFGAVSQHLKILREAGLVRVRRDGRRRFYRADTESMGSLAAWLEEMWAEALTDLKRLAESEPETKGNP